MQKCKYKMHFFNFSIDLFGQLVEDCLAWGGEQKLRSPEKRFGIGRE